MPPQSYLTKLFRAKYQLSLHEYICKVRIHSAKQMLSETNLSVAEIAARTGFLSSNVLIKTFKKMEGVTPGAFRKINR